MLESFVFHRIGCQIRRQEHNRKDNVLSLPYEQNVKPSGFKDTIKRAFYGLAAGVTGAIVKDFGYADHATGSRGLSEGPGNGGRISADAALNNN